MTGSSDKSEVLHPSAKNLLTRARECVREGQAFDPLHIMLAALSPGKAEIPVAGVLEAFITATKRGELLGGIAVALSRDAKGTSSDDGKTERLAHCERAWQSEARKHNAQITDAVILWTILEIDKISQELLNTFEIQPAVVMNSLRTRFESAGAGGINNPIAATQALQKAQELCQQIKPNPKHAQKGMHPIPVNQLLGALEHTAGDQLAGIVIVKGPHGSPIDYLHQVLALRLGSGEHLPGNREHVEKYHTVHVLNLAALEAGGRNRYSPPEKVLEQALEHSVTQKTILMLDRVEILGKQTEIAKRFRAILLNKGKALVFGVYAYYEPDAPGIAEARLGLLNANVLPVQPYDAEDTKTFLNTFYAPQWMEQGYCFAADAFDSVIALELGAWIGERRKTLPYLAVGLGQDAIDSAAEGDEYIKETAQKALKELQKLHQEEWGHAAVPETMKVHFGKILEQAETDINRLLKHPSPPQRDGMRELTRAHVVAQLLCPINQSEFHFPPLAPDWRTR